MQEQSLSLIEFGSEHLDLLASWLRQPHVKPWYPDPQSDLELAASPEEGGGCALIVLGNEPIGFIRWQLVPKAVLDDIGFPQLPDNSADVDLLIGERSAVARGMGGKVLAAMEEKLGAMDDVPLVGLTTAKDNKFAHRAFERAGYRVAGEYTPEAYGPCYLYVKKLA